MMKYLFLVIFMLMMLMSKNLMLMFYYNICFICSILFIFSYMNINELIWMSVGNYMGYDFYSFNLIMLSLWVIGLMLMSLNKNKSLNKIFLFIIMLIILMMFFSSMNLVLFYFFFEISLIPTFILIIYYGYNPERLKAAYYLLMYTMFISLPLLFYMFKMIYLKGSFDYNILLMEMDLSLNLYEYMMYIMAFLIKMPIYMFHIWLPKAHVEAPVYGSMVLAAILLKLGSYGLLRFMMILMKSSAKFSYIIMSIGIIGSLLVSLMCMVQIDMKSLVAYSSVVHMNLMMCSMMTLFKLGMVGAYIMMISHGLCSSGLFYMVNLYYYQTSSRLLMFNKGMMNILPKLSILWLILCIINFSFPLSLNFIGEIFMLMTILNWDFIMMIFLMLVGFFSSAYSIYLYSYIQHGEYMKNYIKISMSSVMEMMILLMHVYPLILMLMNMMLFE